MPVIDLATTSNPAFLGPLNDDRSSFKLDPAETPERLEGLISQLIVEIHRGTGNPRVIIGDLVLPYKDGKEGEKFTIDEVKAKLEERLDQGTIEKLARSVQNLNYYSGPRAITLPWTLALSNQDTRPFVIPETVETTKTLVIEGTRADARITYTSEDSYKFSTSITNSDGESIQQELMAGKLSYSAILEPNAEAFTVAPNSLTYQDNEKSNSLFSQYMDWANTSDLPKLEKAKLETLERGDTPLQAGLSKDETQGLEQSGAKLLTLLKDSKSELHQAITGATPAASTNTQPSNWLVNLLAAILKFFTQLLVQLFVRPFQSTGQKTASAAPAPDASASAAGPDASVSIPDAAPPTHATPATPPERPAMLATVLGTAVTLSSPAPPPAVATQQLPDHLNLTQGPPAASAATPALEDVPSRKMSGG